MPRCLLPLVLLVAARFAWAGAGDVQTRTDDLWYPGELACSTFPRLFRTQAEVYTRETGRPVTSDEDRALASWHWRNTHYYHATEGSSDLWGKGPGQGTDDVNREYWTGLFAHGFSLCYATHAQWHGEMQALLGPGRCRACGVAGHTSFEVFLTGGEYGVGRWALLDHDVSTVYFTPDGGRLMSLAEVSRSLDRLKGRTAADNRGWLPGGLHPADVDAYKTFNSAFYAFGYAGVPPMVHLRSGETLRRYLKPGLEDGKTFVYWGINFGAGGIAGPHRDRTWVNQPERMYDAERNAGSREGQWYGNAVYTYRPDFAGGKYREATIEDTADHVTLEFYTPYVIGCTPADLRPEQSLKAIYQPGGKNGLIIRSRAPCTVRVSVDQGRSWSPPAQLAESVDLTDDVKGHQQYWLRFDAPAKSLADADITIRTVCQSSISIVPRVHAGLNRVACAVGGLAYVSAGPDMPQAETHVIEGRIGGNRPVTLELAAPRGAQPVRIYAVQRQASGAPPRDSTYKIECSADGGATWRPVVSMPVIRHKPEPDDFWSQSHIWGDAAVEDAPGAVRVRFDPAGATLQRCEAHLVYRVENTSPVTVTYAWEEAGQPSQATHTYPPGRPGEEDTSWSFTAGENPVARWVEYKAE